MGLFNWGQTDCLERAMSPAALNYAWQTISRDRGCWVRGVPLEEVRRDMVRHLGELAESVRNGSYRPDPMACHEIPKADGGKRLISVSALRDRLLQRSVLAVVEPMGEAIFSESSYGYRPLCNREMAFSQVRHWVKRDWEWLVDADIRKCFDQIPYDAALQRLQKLCKDRKLVRLVALWIESFPSEYRVASDRGLPQGMVLSPFLCNLYLHEMDRFFERRGMPFVRFADDFIVFARSEVEAHTALKLTQQILHKLKLEIHPEKTQVIRSHPRYRFLGFPLPLKKPRFRP